VTRDLNGDDIVDLILDHEPQRSYAATDDRQEAL
jgi:hypothetical protein